MSTYREVIREALVRAGHADIDARHVEAHVRAEAGGTLDHLAPAALRRWALRVLPYVASMTREQNEQLARSYGLL